MEDECAMLKTSHPFPWTYGGWVAKKGVLNTLTNIHVSFSEELQARGRSRVDAEIGECMQGCVPVLFCMRVFQHDEGVGVVCVCLVEGILHFFPNPSGG